MAARVLLQRRAAPLTAALVVGTIAFAPRVAHAEASSEDRRFSKKPIYDDDYNFFPPPSKTATPATTTTPPTTSTTVAVVDPAAPSTAIIPANTTLPTTVHPRPSPTALLAAQIRQGRLFLYHQSCTAEDAVNAGMARLFRLEHSFTSTLSSLAPARESGERLMPGLVYVLVAGMAGSIVARNRGVLLRGTTPLAFALGAAWSVLPVTMGNVSALAWRYEQRVPAVAEAHVQVREGVEKGVSFVRVHANLGERKLTEAIGSVRETLEGWVAKGK
ncbi:micos subunit MIC26 [Podospora conica]|nr:micos subunit MIC26 [Schizothecium conicum]